MARLDLTGADVSPAICEDIVPDGEYLAVIVRSHLRWTRTRKGRYIQLVVRIIDGDFEGFQIVDRCYVESQALAGSVDEGRRKLAGLCAATGTLLPPICTGHAADLVATPSARMVLGGVGIALLGIVAVGVAGRLKEGEMSEEAKKKAVAEFDFRKGLVTAVIAGVPSAGINFGLQGAPELERAALDAGASPTWAGMPVLTVVLWGGVLTQLVWSICQHRKNRSFGDYRFLDQSNNLNNRTIEQFSPWTLLVNYLLSILVGIIGVMQFVLQKAGEPLMGDFRYISFAVLMSSAVFFSTILGVFLGEWKGTSVRTKALLAGGIVILAIGFTVMALGGR